MDLRDERAELRRLLDAVDARDPDLLSRVAGRPREGVLFGPLERHGLSDTEWAVLLVALAARLDGRPSLSGQELVAGAAEGSARRLEALGLLTGHGPLVRGGLLVPEVPAGDGPAALEATWRLGRHPFHLACAVFGQRDASAVAPPSTAPYRNNTEVLSDLRRLSLVYRRRAARVFHLDPWSGTGIEADQGVAELVDQARAEALRVSRRLRDTTRAEVFPILELRDEFRLDLDALVILVTVLFQEMVEGVGAVDAVDLVKLVAVDEGDLVRRRGILRPLVRKNLLRLEGAYAGKDLTADASLPNEIVERMLGSCGSLSSDDRIEFHRYLRDLDSSEAFFLDMDRRSDRDT